MAMLTVAPLVNMCGWVQLDSGLDPTHFYNRQWMATEVIELLGMTLLCISFIKASRHLVLMIELSGYITLMIAAMFTVNIHSDRILPEFIVRLDHIHVFDTCGLCLLCVCAIGQWHMEGLTEEYDLAHPTPNRSRAHSNHRIAGGDKDFDDHTPLVRRVINESESSEDDIDV